MKKNERDFAEQFRTPETTDEAFSFGRAHASLGYKRFSRAQFFRNVDEADFMYPSRLYRAYKRGREVGHAYRTRRRLRREAQEEE